MSDLKLDTSALPKVLVAQQVASSETTVYTCPAGTTTKLSTGFLVNTTGSTVNNVRVSLVKTGGTAGDSNRVIHLDMTTETRVDLGSLGWLGPGDFVSAICGTASAVSLVITGIEFSAGGGGATGIQFDAIGAGGRSSASTTTTCTHTVGSGNNRYLIAGLVTSHDQWITAYTDYDTLTVSSSNGGSLTRLISAEIGPSGQRQGTAHLFGMASPPSGAHTLTATVSDASVTVDNAVLQSLSYSGVSGTSGAVATSPTTTGTLSLTATSATGKKVIGCFAMGDLASGTVPTDFNRPIRHFNGFNGVSSVCDMMMMSETNGAASVAHTTSNTMWISGVAISLDAA